MEHELEILKFRHPFLFFTSFFFPLFIYFLMARKTIHERLNISHEILKSAQCFACPKEGKQRRLQW